MKKRLFGLTLGILFACGTLHSQTSMPVPFGSFEQWTTHPGYSVTVLGLPMNLYSDYSTPNGWDILTYPINETFSFVGNNITVNTSVPLAIVSQETGYVPNGSSAARLQTFMLNNIVTGLAYAVAAPQLDTMLTQTVFPSILATGTVNFDSLFPLVNTLVANTDSIEDMLVSLAYTDVNSLITGGISLAGFEPSRLTGSYKYHSADSGDNGAVILLGTHYNAVTHQRNVVGGGINYALTDVTNYTPFTVDYVSLHSFESTFPEQAPDSLIVLIVSSASENRQQGSYLCIDNLMLWHDSTGTVLPDTCAAITWFSATPGIHDAAINWSAGGIVGSYEMEYGVAGFTQGEGTSVYLTNNTYSLTNLDANTSYDVYLRTVCNDSIYGDWSSLLPFIVGDNSFTGDFIPSNYYSTGTGTSHTTAFSFDEGTLATVLQKGIVIQGHGIRLNKVTITATSGITLTEADKAAVNAPAYTLGGQRVSQPLPGHLYIQNGKKFIAR